MGASKFMIISVVSGKELTENHIQKWREIQDSDPRLMSPYFCPEFTQAVASIRNDVYVSVITEGDKVVGFFPFQRRRFGFGIPAGGRLSDIHGLIKEKDYEIDLKQLLKKSGLISYDFHAVPVWQEPFQRYINESKTFYYIDLSHGYENYASILLERKSKHLKDAGYKLRKLKRDYNNVEFKHYVSDESVIDLLIDWKSQQYQQSGLVDVLSFPWTKDLLYKIHKYRTDRFSGILSILTVDEKPIAIHMGMCSSKAWNWWFPRHDPGYNKYSPGILLRLNAIEYAEKIGINYIHLGCGDDTTYKPHLSTDTTVFGSGSVELPSFYVFVRKIFFQLAQRIRESVFYTVLKIPGRVIFKFIRHKEFD